VTRAACGTPPGNRAALVAAGIHPAVHLPEMSAEKMAKLFIIQIRSGQHAGRYVGGYFGGGLVTNPVVQKNPPVNVPGSNKHGLWAQERAAMKFLEQAVHDAAAELTQLGLDVQITQVQ
jgi:hypothetical protein